MKQFPKIWDKLQKAKAEILTTAYSSELHDLSNYQRNIGHHCLACLKKHQ